MRRYKTRLEAHSGIGGTGTRLFFMLGKIQEKSGKIIGQFFKGSPCPIELTINVSQNKKSIKGSSGWADDWVGESKSSFKDFLEPQKTGQDYQQILHRLTIPS